MFINRNQLTKNNDASLVLSSLGGDRDAFCEIVSRYQNLLCSIAYSSVGDIKHSEDIAQEAFVEAWRKLDSLKDPEKLKSWLCGILRFKVSHYRRKEQTQPVKDAAEIEHHDMADTNQGEMDDVAIEAQQHQLMWQTLDKMEATYREPLILFYREECSVEQVANELDLTVDTAKQRLSRGRKLLHTSMVNIVEEALVKTKPGTAFTVAVLSAITGIAPPAKAAAMGAGTVQAGSMFKWSSIIAFVGAFSGFFSAWFGLKAGLVQSRTERERRHTIKVVSAFIILAVLYVAGAFLLKHLALGSPDSSFTYLVVSQVMVAAFVASYIWLTLYMFKAMLTIRAQERIFNPQAFSRPEDQPDAKQREYKSALRLLGVPLCHFRFGMPEKGDKPVFGWIAGGDKAYGLLFAWGAFAVAPVSVGIISVGVVTVGAVGFGLLALGTVAFGVIGFGSSAVAYKAYSSLTSVGWESALSGGFALAKEGALGAIAFASEANTELAEEITQLHFFTENYIWALAAIAVFVITPAALYSVIVKQRLG